MGSPLACVCVCVIKFAVAYFVARFIYHVSFGYTYNIVFFFSSYILCE